MAIVIRSNNSNFSNTDYLCAIWWPEKVSVQIEWKGKQYDVSYGHVTGPFSAETREKKALEKTDYCFYRFYFKMNKLQAKKFQKDLDDEQLSIINTNCSGSTASLLHTYCSGVSLDFFETLSPLRFGIGVFNQADIVEFVGQKKHFKKAAVELNSWSNHLREASCIIYTLAIIVLAMAVTTIIQPEQPLPLSSE